MRNQRQRSKAQKREITLMTLLANEATADSRKLLKKHGQPDAKSVADLENKLAKLYFDSSDKIAIEKELAIIHPHAKWLLKSYPAKVEIKKEEVVDLKPTETATLEAILAEVKKTPTTVETSTPNQGACPNMNCPVHYPGASYNRIPYDTVLSNFMGTGNESNRQNNNSTDALSSPMGLIALVAVVGITLYVVSKNN